MVRGWLEEPENAAYWLKKQHKVREGETLWHIVYESESLHQVTAERDLKELMALLLSQASANHGFETQELKICGFQAIYNIGDSLSNTGNNIRINSSAAESQLPDGTAVRSRVPLDYIVKSAGFSSIKAYLNTNETDSHNGVNFAFSGATTLPAKVLVPKLNVDAGVIVNSLDTQLQWFDTYLKGFCQETKDCKGKLKSSLFIMGEIGANDYNMAFHIAGKTIEEKVIHYGFTRVLVPGIYRVGCAPGYASKFAASHTLDRYGCVKEFNDFFNHHNDLLQADLEKLRKKYPGVSIVYGDYYNAMQHVMDNYKKFGFEYTTQGCYVDQGKPPCSDPQKHMFWDVYHSAENSNKYMASWIVEDIVSKFGCK
ncbi:hypothetical protein OIU84_003421 [Salix udensis]|uniref:GDSL esterase/lipase n=1 Tax=Salix udensis TaxID=889485 RepID=A0AAD6P356_9ROSI|nr:hypothetical protein OIU84_003421 [Salix udensis]